MKLFVQNTARGLVPLYDSDFEEKKKLRIGEVYSCEIRRPRNYELHKKYFALIRMAYSNLPEVYAYSSEEVFRKAVQVMAGYFEESYTMDGEKLISATSISFSSMDNDEFQLLYRSVLDVLLKHVFKGCTGEDIEENILSFM
jgi:hypothetical protein